MNDWPGDGGSCLLSWHLGGRCRLISEFESSLVYRGQQKAEGRGGVMENGIDECLI